MDVTQAGGINYGIGGNYLGTLQTGLTPVITPTTTPFPPDSFTPTIFGAPPPPAYLAPPPGGNYQVPPQPTYYKGPGAGQGSFTYDTAKASFANADDYLEQKRHEAINQGRPDLLAQINKREDQIAAAEGRVDGLNSEDSGS